MTGTILAWSDALRVGDESIDSQHRRLLELVQGLSDDGEYENDKLAEVLDYAIYHFSEEEALMEEIGYPDLERHKEAHARLTEILCTQRDAYRAREVHPAAFRHFMTEWVRGHIMQNDRKIGEFIREQAAVAEVA